MNNLAKVRKQLGLTQYQLAQALGVGQGRISNYEVGLRTPSLAFSRKIVNTLNKLGLRCSLDDVFPPQN